jgi:hypothetical protein
MDFESSGWEFEPPRGRRKQEIDQPISCSCFIGRQTLRLLSHLQKILLND